MGVIDRYLLLGSVWCRCILAHLSKTDGKFGVLIDVFTAIISKKNNYLALNSMTFIKEGFWCKNGVVMIRFAFLFMNASDLVTLISIIVLQQNLCKNNCIQMVAEVKYTPDFLWNKMFFNKMEQYFDKMVLVKKKGHNFLIHFQLKVFCWDSNTKRIP